MPEYTQYDWAQSVFNLVSSGQSDIEKLVLEAGLDPKAGDLSPDFPDG